MKTPELETPVPAPVNARLKVAPLRRLKHVPATNVGSVFVVMSPDPDSAKVDGDVSVKLPDPVSVPDTIRVPAFNAIAPVNEEPAAVSVAVPVPDFCMAPAPVIVQAHVTDEVVEKMTVPATTFIVPVKLGPVAPMVIDPVVTFLNVPVPETVERAGSVAAVDRSTAKTDPEPIVILEMPANAPFAPLLPIVTVPLESGIVMVPVTVLETVKIAFPVPCFSKPFAPATMTFIEEEVPDNVLMTGCADDPLASVRVVPAPRIH